MTLKGWRKRKSSSLRGALATTQSSSFLFCLLGKKQGVAGSIFPIDQFDQSGLGALAGFV
jgi:hypothetical protein